MRVAPPLPPPRPREAHKGAMGRALLLGGSRALPGAIHLMTGGALRGGVGYAVVATPSSLQDGLVVAHPEAIHVPLDAEAGWHFTPADLAESTPLLQELSRCQALAVGPGLGSHPETARAVRELLLLAAKERPKLPVVLDADALNHLAAAAADGSFRWDALQSLAVVLTPHPGEAGRLLHGPGAAAIAAGDRVEAWRSLCQQTGATVLLKGAETLIGGPGAREPWVNPTGNPGLASAGTGDVLTGLLAALLARGCAPVDAARLAAWLHGTAADLLLQQGSVEALLARDLLRALPLAWHTLEEAAR